MQDILDRISNMEREELVSRLTEILHDDDNKKQNDIRLKDFKIKYLLYLKKIRGDKYVRSVQLSFQHLISYFGPNCLLKEISVKESESFIIRVGETAPRGFLTYFRDLKAAFNKAVKWDYIIKNPFNDVSLPKISKKRRKIISDTELELILKNANNQFIKDVITFARYTGCRRSEIANLKWESIDFDNMVITIGDDDYMTKGNEQRMIPMHEKIYELLKDITKRKNKRKSSPNGYVFTKPTGFPYHIDKISEFFRIARNKAGLSKDIKFHSLRHTFATSIANNNQNIFALQNLMGHKNISTTQIYVHVSEDSLIQAVASA